MTQNFDHTDDDYGDRLVSKVFGENHQKIMNFEDFKESVKTGKVSLNFKYDNKLISEFVDNQNRGFYFGINNLKIFGTIIYMIYSIFVNQDYNVFYLIPVLYLIRSVIFFMWYKKLMTTIILISISYIVCYYFNINYKTFLITFIILQSISYSAYLLFLEQYFCYHEIRFGYGIENNLISKIYDGYNKRIFNNFSN